MTIHLSAMAIITLTTDWGTRDFFSGAFKGKLLASLPDAQIVDISHEIIPYNIAQAAFVLRQAFHEFPPGSIHVASVNATASRNTPHVVVENEDQYFIGADNGLLSLLFDKAPSKIIEIDIPQDSPYFIFPARDIFVKTAVHIANGREIEELGFPQEHLMDIVPWKSSTDKDPETGNDRISGRIIYVDNYGNCHTNIREEEFIQVRKNRPFNIHLPATTIEQEKLYDAYDEVSEGKMLAIISSTGFLQIAINQGPASQLLGLEAYESTIIVEFKDFI
ncbi:MAG: SAM hydrolase/SAM-dependent halogenase family protein [Bacteroidota bacterium]